MALCESSRAICTEPAAAQAVGSQDSLAALASSRQLQVRLQQRGSRGLPTELLLPEPSN